MPPDDILANNLPAEIYKGLVDVGAAARARLVVRGVAPVLGDGEGAGVGDGAIFLEIALIPHDNEGHMGVVFDADNLVAEFGEFGEGGEGGDGEDEEEALAGFHV